AGPAEVESVSEFAVRGVAADDSERGLHVRGWNRRYVRLGCACSSRSVITYKRGQHLYHDGVVAGGVAGQPLQRVDAAQPHVQLVRAQLLDRFAESVGELALLCEFV